jgi:hypothetical protein
MAVLGAFVRRTGKLTGTGEVPWPADEADRDEFKPSFRLQAALEVLARPAGRGPPANAPDLRDSDLRGARFDGAHLESAVFRRSFLAHAHFDDAHLNGAKFNDADLTRARFDGADLTGADLTRAYVTSGALTDAQLAGVRGQVRIVDTPDATGRTYRRAVVAFHDALVRASDQEEFLEREKVSPAVLASWREESVPRSAGRGRPPTDEAGAGRRAGG